MLYNIYFCTWAVNTVLIETLNSWNDNLKELQDEVKHERKIVACFIAN